MKSKLTPQFRAAFSQLPNEIQTKARKAYKLFRENPDHPSLQFKHLQGTSSLYSVRISIDYRAVGILRGDTIFWTWIGSHSEYDQLLRR